MQEIFIEARDKFLLSTLMFSPKKPKAVVQIVHGSLEHKERYCDFANFLCEHDFAVVIADNRGHGASISPSYPRGFSGTLEQNIMDMEVVTEFIKTNFPSLPIYMFGHSLGSVFARVFLQKHDTEIQKLALSGTVNYNPFAWQKLFHFLKASTEQASCLIVLPQ